TTVGSGQNKNGKDGADVSMRLRAFVDVDNDGQLPALVDVDDAECSPSTHVHPEETHQRRLPTSGTELSADLRRFEYCGQPIPNGWSVCVGCQCVFIKDGQLFCGLCKWRTASGSAYQRLLNQNIQGMMDQEEEIKRLLNQQPVERNPAPPVVAQPDPEIPAPIQVANQHQVEELLEDIQVKDMLLED
ncbi:unnamed protein product, partial [Allacma fusca]